MGSPLFRGRIVNGLEWKPHGQEGAKVLKNNSFLPILDNLEGMQPRNLSTGAHKLISQGIPYI